MEGVTELRWVEWQRIFLPLVTIALLLGYLAFVHLLTRRRPLRTALRYGLAAAIIFTAVWLTADVLSTFVAFNGISDVSIEYEGRAATRSATIGLPSSILESLIDTRPDWLLPWVWAAPVFIIVLSIGLLLILLQRVLARSLLSLERNGKFYLGVIAATACAALLVFAWPRSSRHPDIPSVPIPGNAVAVKFGYFYGKPWPLITFGINKQMMSGARVVEIFGYYEEALAAENWVLEKRELNVAEGIGPSKLLFAREDKVLEITAYLGYYVRIEIMEREPTPFELKYFSERPNPPPSSALQP